MILLKWDGKVSVAMIREDRYACRRINEQAT
jgi:hypothetical protein